MVSTLLTITQPKEIQVPSKSFQFESFEVSTVQLIFQQQERCLELDYKNSNLCIYHIKKLLLLKKHSSYEVRKLLYQFLKSWLKSTHLYEMTSLIFNETKPKVTKQRTKVLNFFKNQISN